ncbi:MarR family transcriptional regulator [Pseudoxanthomonas sp. SGNA-20]|uniref:MarR family winged helix-turn-helix transcriptional regulator n=1 Tax=unclassified Pseudoxanthomonas TaxID=2645906 RepID=UPI00031150EE|nr:MULTISPECIES: MarR family winged helix-turn-helix transcriptional regulator [unclassified Pseudoxanthomonas]RRN56555.1 MarR family transcriptional regulator [Pseudoxanthomonas sp. SGNA-20]
MPAPHSPCTCFRLRRAARLVSQIYDHALAGAGLNVNQYSLLRHARTPQSLGTLAASLGMDRTTLSRNLQPLLRDGLVAEVRDEDPRRRVLALTAAGRQRLARARPLWQRAQRRIDALLGSGPLGQLHAALDALDDALAKETEE